MIFVNNIPCPRKKINEERKNSLQILQNFARARDKARKILREHLSFPRGCGIIKGMFLPDEPVHAERAKLMNPVVLAFVGDAVYTLCVRQRLALASGEKTGALNKRASEKVSAHGQSAALDAILPRLTEEEADIFRRGRNAKKPTKSKNATVGEYVRSTGFEALIGFLYLTGRAARIEELFFQEELS